MESFKKHRRFWKECLIGALLISNLFVWRAFYQRQPDGLLRVYFLDIGQGDAILIDSPRHGRALIDGGRNREVLNELGGILPFGDRRIDAVIATHPDTDHIGGLSEVVSRYDVGVFLEPGVESDSGIDDALRGWIEEKGIRSVLARRGMVVNFGDGVKLVILFPNQDVTNWETNRASIVAKLVYGERSFLLTGDSPVSIENVLLSLNAEVLDSDILKAGHHGSRTSTSLKFAEAVSPEYAVISAGKGNSYGHPHKEVIQILESVDARILSTAESGTIKFETDGQVLKLK